MEQMLLGGLQNYLSEEDKAEYRRPYLEPGESRCPTLTWPREVPLGGEPKRNAEPLQRGRCAFPISSSSHAHRCGNAAPCGNPQTTRVPTRCVERVAFHIPTAIFIVILLVCDISRSQEIGTTIG